MYIFKIAFRNGIKNITKNKITLMAVAIGMAASITVNGFFQAQLNGLKEESIKSNGTFQIYAKGYSKNNNEDGFDSWIKEYGSISDEFKKIDGVESVEPSNSFTGIISAGDKSSVIGGIGTDNIYEKIDTKRSLETDNSEQFVIGTKLAKRLNVKIGDDLTLMSAGVNGGGLNGVNVKITGIFDYNQKDMDNFYGYGKFENIAKLTNTYNMAEKLLIKTDKNTNLSLLEKKIEKICRDKGLEYTTWDEADKMYKSIKEMFNAVFFIMGSIVVLITMFTVTNTVYMNIYDRRREIGTIRAIGTTKAETVLLFFVENIIIGMAGSMAGIAAGLLISLAVKGMGGISINTGGAETVKIALQPDGLQILVFGVILTAAGGFAAVRPSYRGGKRSIADVLREN